MVRAKLQVDAGARVHPAGEGRLPRHDSIQVTAAARIAAIAALLVLAPLAQSQPLRLDVGRNTSPAYEKECGSCHFAYQPGWLPERSWRRMMGSLNSHFGDNATLSQANHDAIMSYLAAGAADKASNARS